MQIPPNGYLTRRQLQVLNLALTAFIKDAPPAQWQAVEIAEEFLALVQSAEVGLASSRAVAAKLFPSIKSS